MTATPPPPPSGPPAPQPQFGQPTGLPPMPQYGQSGTVPPAPQYGPPPQQNGLPPMPQYGQPAQPGAVPPPPPGTQRITVPPVAWLVPLAAALAVIGVFTPWFRPQASGHGQTLKAEDALYSWKDGKIGLLAPILLIGVAVTVVGLLRNKVHRRLSGSDDPVRKAALFALGAGVAALVCCVIAWFLVTSQYDFDGLSWDEFEQRANANGYDVGRGPQIGYWLTIAGGVVAAIAGGLMLAMHKKPEATSPVPPPPPGSPNLQK